MAVDARGRANATYRVQRRLRWEQPTLSIPGVDPVAVSVDSQKLPLRFAISEPSLLTVEVVRAGPASRPLRRHARSLKLAPGTRNDAKETFEWLDRAWSNRDPGIDSLLYGPFILRYKNDPRYAAFCRKVGLPVPGETPARKST
jgi:hypothetical protein